MKSFRIWSLVLLLPLIRPIACRVNDDDEGFLDCENPAYQDIDWNKLSDRVRDHFENEGWTQVMWDSDEDPYFILDWDEMTTEMQDALVALGWDADLWKEEDSGVGIQKHFSALSIPWEKLSLEQRDAAEVLGYSEKWWNGNEWGSEFTPLVVSFTLPQLEKLDLDYLASLDVEVELMDGQTVGDDEWKSHQGLTMKDFVSELKKGSKLYLKYEDDDPFKEVISDNVGSTVLDVLGGALRNSTLREKGYFKTEYDDYQMNDDHWLIFVGGTNTSTSMHYDYDEFNFIWVAQGRKRVVLVPNDQRTASQYDCVSYVDDNSCWSGEDILNGNLPEHAVEVEIGPGQGLMIPNLSWHAVKNLEPTVAYGIRVKRLALMKRKDPPVTPVSQE